MKKKKFENMLWYPNKLDCKKGQKFINITQVWVAIGDTHLVNVSVCLCYSSVFRFFSCFPFIVDVFPSVLVCNPNLLSLNTFSTFEQRYTTVVIIKSLLLIFFLNSHRNQFKEIIHEVIVTILMWFHCVLLDTWFVVQNLIDVCNSLINIPTWWPNWCLRKSGHVP